MSINYVRSYYCKITESATIMAFIVGKRLLSDYCRVVGKIIALLQFESMQTFSLQSGVLLICLSKYRTFKTLELGRIVIPKEIRDTFGIFESDGLEIFYDDKTIMLKQYTPACIFCNSAEGLVYFKNKGVCKNCLDESKNA